MRECEVIEPRKNNKRVDVDRVTYLANKIGNIVKRDIMRNLPGSLGHGEFYIVILSVPERTYIFLSLRGLKHQ